MRYADGSFQTRTDRREVGGVLVYHFRYIQENGSSNVPCSFKKLRAGQSHVTRRNSDLDCRPYQCSRLQQSGGGGEGGQLPGFHDRGDHRANQVVNCGFGPWGVA